LFVCFKYSFSCCSLRFNWSLASVCSSKANWFFNPSFGSGIKALLFEQTNDLTQLEEQISIGISNNVENIRVNSVNATQNNNEIYININYTINNQTDELTLALDINE
jgi:hypothetical protein